MKRTFFSKYAMKWWMIVIWGVLFGLISPPYNSELHWGFTYVPLLSIPLLLPYIAISSIETKRKRFFTLWLWGTAATFARVYWLKNVTIESKYGQILLAIVLLSAFLGLWYTLVGMFVPTIKRVFGKQWILIFPLLWVLSDYLKTVGELSFPWMMQGYLFLPYSFFAQLASVTGIWGLTSVVIFLSVLLYSRFVDQQKNYYCEAGALVFIVAITVWGWNRLDTAEEFKPIGKVALIQSHIDHKNWDRDSSLTASMIVSDSMIQTVKDSSVDLVILPESGVYAYLDHRWNRKRLVMEWVREAEVPILLGTLDHETDDSGKMSIYNSTFLLRPNTYEFEKYFKMKLVPVSEGIPYGWKFDILSRIKVVGGFSRGFDNTKWKITDSLTVAPTICYEAIYPNFNRVRGDSVNVIVNTTNDSWFGISQGPYQHSQMARMRTIETGIPMIRCAASGISFVADGYGRVIAKTGIYTREVLVSEVPDRIAPTIYFKFGNWFILFSVIVTVVGAVIMSYKDRIKMIDIHQ